jgi:DNA-binding response OmpR family regulator
MTDQYNQHRELARGRILVVEDDPNTSSMLVKYLAGEGYFVRAVNCGRDALTVSERWLPNLILLDMSLPDMHGLEVCVQLRANEHTEQIPIVFLTQKSDSEVYIHGVKFGPADDYILKPFDVEELKLRARKAIEGTLGLE